jgi:hypothetical protein
MTMTLPGTESLSLLINQEICVRATLEVTFAALLDQLGPYNEKPDGSPIPMHLEPWPGGRWYRDLGDGNGHFWAHVQAIKRPTLIELAGPLFMSYPVANNLQYRLTQEKNQTVIRFCHSGFGLIQEQHRTGVVTGWTFIHEKVRQRAEGLLSKSRPVQ